MPQRHIMPVADFNYSDYLHVLHAYWLNYFLRAEGVQKAIEQVEICGVYCSLFNFALC